MRFSYGLVAGTMALAPAVSMAELTGNVGIMSDYVFRGAFQEDASAMGGLDYAHDSGFYIGTWAADVGEGLETDLYFGYGGEAGDFSYSIGYTGYFYTDDFDSEYNELNLGIGYAGLTLDVAVGTWDGIVGDPLTEDDYVFTSLGYAFDSGFYITLGSWDYDTAIDTADYAEIGYGFEWEGFDLSFALINSSDLPVTELGWDPDVGVPASADNIITFSISKSFTLAD